MAFWLYADDPDKYPRDCERCGAKGRDPIPGSIKADAKVAAKRSIEKIRRSAGSSTGEE